MNAWAACAIVAVLTAAVVSTVAVLCRRSAGAARWRRLKRGLAVAPNLQAAASPATGESSTSGGSRELDAIRERDVTNLTDIELCRLWRCTYPPLVAPATAEALEQLGRLDRARCAMV